MTRDVDTDHDHRYCMQPVLGPDLFSLLVDVRVAVVLADGTADQRWRAVEDFLAEKHPCFAAEYRPRMMTPPA